MQLGLPAPRAESVGAFCLVLFGYVAFSWLLQVAFFQRRRGDEARWKSQPGVGYAPSSLPWLPLLRLFGAPGAPHDDAGGPHSSRLVAAFATFNLLLAASFAGAATELLLRGRGRMYWAAPGAAALASELALAALLESALEYYWHRAMHLPFFYRRFHKLHHAFTAPRPFDDMSIHPLEALGYYCILYCPPFALRMHPLSFGAYMALMGVCGVCDHCGVRLRVPGYDSRDHDLHHEKFSVNYGFPFVFLDLLHGTYEAPPERGALGEAAGAAPPPPARLRRSAKRAFIAKVGARVRRGSASIRASA